MPKPAFFRLLGIRRCFGIFSRGKVILKALVTETRDSQDQVRIKPLPSDSHFFQAISAEINS